MFYKVLFGILCLSALQCFVSCNQIYSPKEVIEEAHRQIETLNKVITVVLNDASEKLSHLIDELVMTAEQSTDITIKEVDGVTKYYLGRIKEMEENAEKLGVDIAECTVGNMHKITDLPRNLYQNCRECMDVHIASGKKEVSGTLNTKLMDFANRARNITAQLKNCGTEIISIPCITGVINEAKEQKIQVPVDVAALVFSTSKLISDKKAFIAWCGTDQAIVGVRDLTDIVFDITECYNEKIAGASH